MAASTITIRRAEPRDAAALVDFQLRMAEETEHLHLDRATVTAGVGAVLSDPARGTYWIAEFGGEVAGGLLVLAEWSDWRNGTVWWIHSVYVVPAHRRSGVFRALYQHLKSLVLADGSLKGLRLYVDKTNLPAQKTYESLGMNGEHYRLYEWMK